MKRIVLTGGPCGGKTTSLARITERLQYLGYQTFVVPETATMIFGAAALHPPSMSQSELFGFENSLLQMQKGLEDSFAKLASYSKKPAVLICDRGAMDVAAFLTPEMWQAVLDEHQTREIDLRDGRYDAVIHVTTAAQGAEEFYSLDNNPARTETPEQAREADRRILQAWTGHPHLRVVGNDQDFESKIQEIVSTVCNAVGLPEPYETERKFLVGEVRDIPVHHVTVEIEQTYLRTENPEIEARIRRRGQGGSNIYTHCTKQRVNETTRIEKERQIGAREYVEFLSTRDPMRRTIRKMRTCFLWEGRYFELDQFTDIDPPDSDDPVGPERLVLLEVELESPDQKVALPPFLDIAAEVTESRDYSNYALSLGKTDGN